MERQIDREDPPGDSLERVRVELTKYTAPLYSKKSNPSPHTTVKDALAALKLYDEQVRALSEQLAAQKSVHDVETKNRDNQAMTNHSDFRHEMELRDQSIHREIKVRERAFRRELAAHNKLMDYRLGEMETATNKVVEATKASRYWMAGIGVAVILGIMGANATLVGSAGSIFDSGKAALQRQQDLEKLARQAQEQSAQTQQILEAIQAQQKQQQVQQPKP